MAHYLVLDWDHQHLHLMYGTVRHGAARPRKAVVLEEPKSPTPADAAELGRRLRERLKEAGIASGPVLACVGRDRVILKDVRHPAVPAAEEPGVVRFQVVKELTEPADEAVIDYVPSGQVEAGGERRALGLVVRRDLVTAYRELCRAAGLKLAGLTPRPVGTAVCLTHLLARGAVPAPEPADGAVAVLTVGQPWAEFCVIRQGGLVLARSLAASATLPGEVRRTLAVYNGQAPQHPVRALYVTGQLGDELGGRLRETAGVPVHAFDPFAAGAEGAELPPPGQRGGFAASVGLLEALAAQRTLPVNFVAPKEPRPARNPNRHRVALAVGLAAAVVVGVVGYCYAQLAAKDAARRDLERQRQEFVEQVALMSDDVKRTDALDQWSNNGIVWLDELYDLTERFPDPNTIRLVQLTAETEQRTAANASPGKLTLKGIMGEDFHPIDQLIGHLAEDGHYNPGPKQVKENRSVDRFRFRQEFSTVVKVDKIPPEKYVRRIPEEPRDGKRRRRTDAPAGDFGGGFGGFGGFGGGAP